MSAPVAMPEKFLRTVRFDGSDEHVFAHAAAADELAVSGSFAFSGVEAADIVGKTRQAFANGFLGLGSFGRATFATISDVTADERATALEGLARHFVEAWDAPGLEPAREVAREEFNFIDELCAGQPVNTIFTVSRRLEDGEIHEQFRIVTPDMEAAHTRIWDIVDDTGDDIRDDIRDPQAPGVADETGRDDKKQAKDDA